MSRVVKHKLVYRKTVFGGESNWTLCLRVSGADCDGMNIADSDDQVTCKFCLKIMANPLHWAHRNIIKEP